MRYRGDNRIQAYSTKNRPVLGLGLSFGGERFVTCNDLSEALDRSFRNFHMTADVPLTPARTLSAIACSR